MSNFLNLVLLTATVNDTYEGDSSFSVIVITRSAARPCQPVVLAKGNSYGNMQYNSSVDRNYIYKDSC